MGEEIKELLDREIAEEIKNLSGLSDENGEKSTAIANLEKLYRLKIDESKMEWDVDEKYSRREMETKTSARDEEFRNAQLNEQVKDRYFRIGIAAAELILPLIFYGIWMRKGFKFEETGAYTSTTFKGLFNRFRPTKK